ncbi:MAG TPA: hypothetical protein VFW66_07120 [Gemmatimonadales bacterium]|nr:hypothetical protein [Gemmatimonadales bacterium]
MRFASLLLILLGVIGTVLGLVTFVEHLRSATERPFWLETYGGPGPIMAGVALLLVGLYLRSTSRSEQ